MEQDEQEKLRQEYQRLHQAMEMVGFLPSTKRQYGRVHSFIHLLSTCYQVNKLVVCYSSIDVKYRLVTVFGYYNICKLLLIIPILFVIATDEHKRFSRGPVAVLGAA